MTREIDTSCAIARSTSPYLESILGHAFPVLDHGFIREIAQRHVMTGAK